jgi:hypothetical protein
MFVGGRTIKTNNFSKSRDRGQKRMSEKEKEGEK